MKPRTTKTMRCRECGAKCLRLADSGICLACDMMLKRKPAKAESEAKSDPSPVIEPPAKAEPAKADWSYKTPMEPPKMDHPALIKEKMHR